MVGRAQRPCALACPLWRPAKHRPPANCGLQAPKHQHRLATEGGGEGGKTNSVDSSSTAASQQPSVLLLDSATAGVAGLLPPLRQISLDVIAATELNRAKGLAPGERQSIFQDVFEQVRCWPGRAGACGALGWTLCPGSRTRVCFGKAKLAPARRRQARPAPPECFPSLSAPFLRRPSVPCPPPSNLPPPLLPPCPPPRARRVAAAGGQGRPAAAAGGPALHAALHAVPGVHAERL